MIDETERAFFLRREAEARAAAKASISRAGQVAHLETAQRYALAVRRLELAAAAANENGRHGPTRRPKE